MSRRNRTEGHKWETECARRLRAHLGIEVETSRYASRKMDDLKVDLIVPPEIPFHFQCKSICGRVPYDKLIEEMPDDRIPVILAKQTEKRKTRFFKTGEYAILPMEEFLKLIK